MKQEIIIKNMVCPRCLEAVKLIFQDLGLAVEEISLGKVILSDKISPDQKKVIKERLAEKGFALLDDKRTQLINKIKAIIVQEIHYTEDPPRVNFSTTLTEKLHYDYSYLSRLFSAVEGQTIERYIMSQKIEKVKELLVYDQLTLSEIAFQLNYSSTAHLSAQFKKITGMTTSTFKQLQTQERKALDEI